MDFVKPAARRKAKGIIVHSGTNDLKQNEPESIVEQILDIGHVIHSISPKTKICFSGVIKRSDDNELNAKVGEVNGLSKFACSEFGFDYIDNSSKDVSCLNRSGLHLNRRGDTSLAKISTVIYVLFDVRNFTERVEMVSGENPSVCSDLEIFNDTATVISNLYLPYLAELRKKYSDNPIIGYLNINSLRYKVVDLRHVLFESELDILAISETKLCDEFPDSHFVIEGYYHPAQFRKDRTTHGGGLIVYVRNGIPVRRVKTFEPPNQEIIRLEITINKRKWLIYSFYRSESFSDLTTFLEELKTSIDKAINKYENIILMDDINVDMSDRNNTHTNYDHVQELSDIFNVTNLIKQTTCFTPTAAHPSLIDIILTNRPRLFQSSVAIETGLSDHHKMVLTVLKCHFVRLQPTTIHYRDYK